MDLRPSDEHEAQRELARAWVDKLAMVPETRCGLINAPSPPLADELTGNRDSADAAGILALLPTAALPDSA